MMDFGGGERREFFRIADNLLINSRQVTAEEAEALKKDLSLNSFSSEIPIRLPDKSSIPDDIHSYLKSLDKKMDLIINMLSGRQTSSKRRCVEANISGSGIRYQSDTNIDVDVFVELRIEFAFSQQSHITILGKVIRSKEILLEGKSTWDVAIHFVAINEKDRDLLISYIFSRERRHLQSTKGSLT
jgi:hypothetical protein